MNYNWNPKTALQWIGVFFLIYCIVLLTACSTQVQLPDRPAMPTDSLEKGVDIDTFVAACIAEIERREGYEIKLRSAIAICNGENKD